MAPKRSTPVAEEKSAKKARTMPVDLVHKDEESKQRFEFLFAERDCLIEKRIDF